MTREEVIEIMREELEVIIETTSEYTGGTDGSGSLYRDISSIVVRVNGYVICHERITP